MQSKHINVELTSDVYATLIELRSKAELKEKKQIKMREYIARLIMAEAGKK